MSAHDVDLPDALVLLPLRQRLTERGLAVRSLHLHRPGRPAVVHRFVDDTAENIYSVSKTVTALAVGIAREEGLLDLDDRAVDHLPSPEGRYGEGVGDVTIRHLLTMTSGSPITVFAQEERDHRDLTSLYLETPLAREAGSAFEYSNGGPFLLSRIIAQRTGQTLRDWLMPRLFQPLDIVNPQWHTTVDGHSAGATGLHLKSGEMARIGEVLAGRGSVDGAELVPAAWVDLMHAEDTWVDTGWPDPDNARYGLGVWASQGEGAWRADGAYGQFLLVLPEQAALVAVTSHIDNGGANRVLGAIREELVPLL